MLFLKTIHIILCLLKEENVKFVKGSNIFDIFVVCW